MTKKGFTLIELLVVIAIIAILAAILFPVFAQAREKARASACLSNTKQLGTALMLYIDDYDEVLPPRSSQAAADKPTDTSYPVYQFNDKGYARDWWVKNSTRTWMDSIFPYVKNINMYKCPSGSKLACGYGYNTCLQGLYNNNGDINTWVAPSLTQITKPSETVCFGDSCRTGDEGATHLQPSFYWPDSSYFTNANGIPPSQSYYLTSTYRYALRHNEGANFTMCDGHAKYYKFGQGPLQLNNNQYGMKDPWWRFTLQ